jgi:hypothetical protein
VGEGGPGEERGAVAEAKRHTGRRHGDTLPTNVLARRRPRSLEHRVVPSARGVAAKDR